MAGQKKKVVISGGLEKECLMLDILIHYLAEFVVQTILLTALLWIMTKIQKLDQRFEYKFIGLAGAAAAAIGLEQILDAVLIPLLGVDLATYISTPIIGGTLFLIIKKVTGADPVDVVFTIGISYALLFCANLFLLASVMPDLRHSGREVMDSEPAVRQVAEEPPEPVETNPPAPAPVSNHVAAAPATPTVSTGMPKSFSIKGVTRNGSKSVVVLQAGNKGYSLFLGDSTRLQTADGPMDVRFSDVDSNSVTLEVNGASTRYPFY